MFEQCWESTLRGSMFRRLSPLCLVEVLRAVATFLRRGVPAMWEAAEGTR